MLKKILGLNRSYHEAKQQAVEGAVKELEGKASGLLIAFLLALLILGWIGAILTPFGPIEVYERTGFFPIIIIFVTSYFFFFLGSKLLVRPNREEVTDDTAMLAVFSACARKERRSLISIGLAALHTFIFLIYMFGKDTQLLDALGV